MYRLVYSNSFVESLEKLIYSWEIELKFPSVKVNKFVQTIEVSLKMLCEFPEMHEEVSATYDLAIPTHRILIGKQYAIFYRVNHESKEILVGAIFHQKQMKMKF